MHSFSNVKSIDAFQLFTIKKAFIKKKAIHLQLPIVNKFSVFIIFKMKMNIPFVF